MEGMAQAVSAGATVTPASPTKTFGLGTGGSSGKTTTATRERVRQYVAG